MLSAASPAGSPAGSPEGSTTFTPGSGSKTAPSTRDGSSSSDGSSTKLSFSLLIFVLIAASYGSIFTIY
ncbi:hypothetical protein SLEP1_g49841 [Rubroshorea leprosula]|uniref:Uncharacterized protein n=1 Tax=Rubroshorea leprosula TaxID=152421 RepID=A0AAV5LYD2_9ROSI|nr:hypothetical protein SLEP1_g49841 [Rubroshorea leprosula]